MLTQNKLDQNWFVKARNETVNYHEQYYKKHTLFEGGSWLEKADPKIDELIQRFAKTPNCRVLDLGAGVGRNAIYMAKALPDDAIITCVELLPAAASQLKEYAEKHNVSKKIMAIAEDFEKISLPASEYNLVLGISVLEHSSSYENLIELVKRLQKATCLGGVHYFNFSTDRAVSDFSTGDPVETFVETRLQQNIWQEDLAKLYSDWNIELLGSMEPYKEVLTYNGRQVIWSSNEMEILALKVCD